MYARLLLSENGTLRGISGTLNDITERKQAEEDLQRQNQILQQELNQAADYVRSLLPRPMTESVVTIEQQFVPSLQLGGDAFDYYWLDSEHLVMYLLDVAGHPPALLLADASTPIQRLEAMSIPIGMLPDADFDDNVCEIKPDSTLYLFSDGVYEIHQANGKIWGLNAFSELLEITLLSTHKTLTQVFDYIQGLSYNSALADDFSLLKIRLS